MRSLCLAVLMLACANVYSQTDAFKFTNIDAKKGLSHNQVNVVFKDSRGYVWVGTASGLNRFNGYTIHSYRNNVRDTTSLVDNQVVRIAEDPHGRIWVNESNIFFYDTDRFTANTTPYLKTYGVPNGSIHDIVKDKQGFYWFVHSFQGLYQYEKDKGPARAFVTRPGDSLSIATNQVSAVADDGTGDLWIIHTNGILEKLNPQSGQVTYRSRVLQTRHNTNLDYQFIVDADGDLWIYASSSPNGVFFFDTNTLNFTFVKKNSAGIKLNTDLVRGIVQDNQGLIWVGTDHGGINLIDKKNRTVRYVLHSADDAKSISQNSITDLYKDDEGIVWSGTYKRGVDYYHENIIRFPLYQHYLSDRLNLDYEDVNRFVEDKQGNLWIGTNGGGLIYFDRTSNTFKQYKNNPADPNSLSNDVIVSLCIDYEGVLWVGTYFGGLNRFDGKKFKRYKNDPTNARTIADDNIWEIFEDSDNNLWIGTLYRGLDLYDRRTDSFQHYRSGEVNSVRSNYISALTEDRNGNLWVGTNFGIDVLNKQTGRFTHYENELDNVNSLSNNLVLYIMEDSKGLVWIGTHGGVNIFNPSTQKFLTFWEADGLVHNTVLTILEDDNHTYWLTTPKGLSNLVINQQAPEDLTKYVLKTYDESDGLQGTQFNENAAYKTSKGELVFGGANGFNLFKPEMLQRNALKPRVVLTDFLLFNKSVAIGEEINGRVPLHKAISETQEVTLSHHDNVLAIEFAALSYLHPEKNRYQYKLDGFNETWVEADANTRKVTYTNLDAGTYFFKVRAANSDGVWNDTDVSLTIKILPPFWATPWAIVLYTLAVFGVLYASRRIALSRVRNKFRLEQERKEALHRHELDEMKIRFLTNVSHEFRTPLSLIITPLERITQQTEDSEQRKQFTMMQRNARRLLNLVNKLLDFRRFEADELKFNPSEGDIVSFIRDAVYSFSDLSEKKEIELKFKTSVNSIETIFDQDKLEKILFNLLSNAFKFTPDHGVVSVELDRVMRTNRPCIAIKVSDTGIGIPADKHEKIFERFYQNELPDHIVNQGSGIGLSLTREFVKIQNGEISVTSTPGVGSTFTVELPLHEVKQTFMEETLPGKVVEPDAEVANLNLPSLLLVEDNEDFRYYLKDNLKSAYRIYEATNGAEGLNKALALMPDLIVSDIMMPVMSGIELCRKVKGESRVSHTPVILLTARSSEEQKLEGLECGADDYITKPFSFDILQLRIKHLIQQRELLHKNFKKLIEVKASDVKVASLDEKLIRKAVESVEANISDAGFTVEDLSRELGVSRVHLYKKLLALTGKTPLEFIRSIRLQQAAQLLEKSQLSVAEVAYQVGFNNPKYFARYFKEEFQVLPSAYLASKSK